MTRSLIKSVTLFAAVCVGALGYSTQTVEARNAVPLIAGIAIGAIVGTAIASGNRAQAYQPRYAAPPRPYSRARSARQHRYARAPEPWTREWFRYCSERHRSFDPHSGTFQPYHGPRQLCR